jgi:hypothetical protein
VVIRLIMTRARSVRPSGSEGRFSQECVRYQSTSNNQCTSDDIWKYISDNQTICYLSAPELFTGTEPAGGDGYYSYLWETSEWGTWSSAEGINGEKNYLSPALSEARYIRRIILSGQNAACKDTSNLVFVGLHPLSQCRDL